MPIVIEQFDHLLADYKAKAEDIDSYKEPNVYELHLSGLKFMPPAHCVKIMESGIFHKGGLKGKKLPVSSLPDYMVFPIIKIKKLIETLAKNIYWVEYFAENKKEKIESEFEQLLTQFTAMERYLRTALPKRDVKIANKIRNQIIAWKEKLLEKFNSPPSSYIYYDFPEMNIAAPLAFHIPDAPALTIANRTADLVKIFGKKTISCRTLRQKITYLRSNYRSNI